MVSSGDNWCDDGDDEGKPIFCNPYVAAYINSDQCFFTDYINERSFSVNVATTEIVITIMIMLMIMLMIILMIMIIIMIVIIRLCKCLHHSSTKFSAKIMMVITNHN